mmetsp:Transcript_2410/g.5622  ORF Transcript_2410/g.5622 Transcript_2410/m.5622 type:complete len:274 (+) Transcript_2410:2075-2896(+)
MQLRSAMQLFSSSSMAQRAISAWRASSLPTAGEDFVAACASCSWLSPSPTAPASLDLSTPAVSFMDLTALLAASLAAPASPSVAPTSPSASIFVTTFFVFKASISSPYASSAFRLLQVYSGGFGSHLQSSGSVQVSGPPSRRFLHFRSRARSFSSSGISRGFFTAVSNATQPHCSGGPHEAWSVAAPHAARSVSFARSAARQTPSGFSFCTHRHVSFVVARVLPTHFTCVSFSAQTAVASSSPCFSATQSPPGFWNFTKPHSKLECSCCFPQA